MPELDPLELHANSWQFLDRPDDYVAASAGHKSLLAESTRRQFLTAQTILNRLNGSQGEVLCRGILLADDVGLGKTTVAALVAWVFAGKGFSVRVLAPNAVMRRRWTDELQSHAPMLRRCAPSLSVSIDRVRTDEVKRLRAGSIQVATHHYAVQESTLSCDLLIIDEAHRAKGKTSSFSQALTAQSRRAARVLILTATPMSIHPDDLQRMMELVGAVETKRPLRTYSNVLNAFYEQRPIASAEQTAKKLAERAEAAVAALAPCVIRHGVGDLPGELASFGSVDPWTLKVPSAQERELELMLRIDRAMRVVRPEREESRVQTNDARYHVGWDHLHRDAEELRRWLGQAPRGTEPVTSKQLAAIRKLEQELGEHPKVKAVAEAVQAKVSEGEKVLLFCFHHATAQELTHAVRERLSKSEARKPRASLADWQAAWGRVLPTQSSAVGAPGDFATLRATFIAWLCSESVRLQVESWIDPTYDLTRHTTLARAVNESLSRRHGPTIANAAADLLTHLQESRSTLGVLRAAKGGRLDLIPGADGVRVLAVCDAPDEEEDQSGFSRSNQPDMAIAIFNSPFGPDALVATDKMSEGIDLHRFCRHLIHYELSASPIRTIQRNGRLRRVNSWAAQTGLPLRIAYPAFGGTRDQRMVSIMKRRIDAFSMLLGGVPTFDEETIEADEQWRAEVVQLLRKKLSHLNGRLAVVRS